MALSQSQIPNIKIIALREKFSDDAKDNDWIPELSDEGDWTIVSQDRFAKGDVEREVLKRAAVTVFRLQPQWSKHNYWAKTQAIVRW